MNIKTETWDPTFVIICWKFLQPERLKYIIEAGRKVAAQEESMTFIESVETLEESLAAPSAADQESVQKLKGDVIILGAGGKMGPSLARKIKRAAKLAGVRFKIIAVSRFSSSNLMDELNRD